MELDRTHPGHVAHYQDLTDIGRIAYETLVHRLLNQEGFEWDTIPNLEDDHQDLLGDSADQLFLKMRKDLRLYKARCKFARIPSLEEFQNGVQRALHFHFAEFFAYATDQKEEFPLPGWVYDRAPKIPKHQIEIAKDSYFTQLCARVIRDAPIYQKNEDLKDKNLVIRIEAGFNTLFHRLKESYYTGTKLPEIAIESKVDHTNLGTSETMAAAASRDKAKLKELGVGKVVGCPGGRLVSDKTKRFLQRYDLRSSGSIIKTAITDLESWYAEILEHSPEFKELQALVMPD